MASRRRFWPSFISPLSARILAIMLLPLALFLVGLFSVDQYRDVLIAAELDALERQGRTLAR
ncbi:MAG: histidine kinase, partial [Alphaproteobacteria bacterium]|nr:histidine kinase [Alphaproteobacteria bacterium]